MRPGYSRKETNVMTESNDVLCTWRKEPQAKENKRPLRVVRAREQTLLH